MSVHHTEGTGTRGDLGEGECPVGSLSEIEAAVEAFRNHVKQWYAEHELPQKKVLVYCRGVSDQEESELVPILGRNRSEEEACKLEKALLKRLLSKLRDLHGDTKALGARKQMAMRFTKLFSQLGPDDDVDRIPVKWQLPLLALAQHYGIPTRLLDWSECPKVAACFAVRDRKKAEEKNGALYMFHDRTAAAAEHAQVFPNGTLEYVRPFRIYQDSIKYFERWQDDILGLDETGRIQNQKAALTVHPLITERMDKQLKESSLSPKGKPRYQKLWQLTIPAGQKKPIREELAKKGITYERLFLGPFQRVCREVAESLREPSAE